MSDESNLDEVMDAVVNDLLNKSGLRGRKVEAAAALIDLFIEATEKVIFQFDVPDRISVLEVALTTYLQSLQVAKTLEVRTKGA